MWLNSGQIVRRVRLGAQKWSFSSSELSGGSVW